MASGFTRTTCPREQASDDCDKRNTWTYLLINPSLCNGTSVGVDIAIAGRAQASIGRACIASTLDAYMSASVGSPGHLRADDGAGRDIQTDEVSQDAQSVAEKRYRPVIAKVARGVDRSLVGCGMGVSILTLLADGGVRICSNPRAC